MKFNRYLLLAIGTLAILWIAPSAHAQEPPTVNARFSVLSFNALVKDLYYFTNGSPKSFSIYQTDITGPHVYKGPPLLQFARKGPPLEDGTPTWIPVGRVQLPLNAKDVLLLFYKAPGEKEQYDIRRIDAFRGDFKLNELMILNFTTLSVGGKFGDKTFQLPTGSTKKFAYPSEDPFETPVMLRLAADRDDGWKLVFSKPFTQVPATRRWIFIVEMSSAPGGIQILPFLERIKPDAPAGQPPQGQTPAPPPADA